VVLLAESAPPEERYNALGDTVNVAARLQAHAAPRGVAVGPITARQVEAHFRLESLGSLELKGKAEPIEAFAVLGEEDVVRRHVSPLVGRDAELELVDGVVRGLTEGRGAIVVVNGEAGAGELRRGVAARERGRGEDLF